MEFVKVKEEQENIVYNDFGEHMFLEVLIKEEINLENINCHLNKCKKEQIESIEEYNNNSQVI